MLNNYFDNIISNGFFPTITLPTRLSNRSSTLIDNIFTNRSNGNDTAGILTNQISDHQPIFIYTEQSFQKVHSPKYITVRNINPKTIEAFQKDLNHINTYKGFSYKHIEESLI